jgi:hypothetical protein
MLSTTLVAKYVSQDLTIMMKMEFVKLLSAKAVRLKARELIIILTFVGVNVL